jgi:hypothetical protein
MTLQVTFQKTGKEIRQAVHNRIEQLQQRLHRRNEALDVFLSDKNKVRSYVIRSAPLPWGGHGRPDSKTLYAPEDISSEEKEEISQLCRRIFEIEQELHRLSLVASHLKDGQVFELPYEDLVAYGFEARLDTE